MNVKIYCIYKSFLDLGREAREDTVGALDIVEIGLLVAPLLHAGLFEHRHPRDTEEEEHGEGETEPVEVGGLEEEGWQGRLGGGAHSQPHEHLPEVVRVAAVCP